MKELIVFVASAILALVILGYQNDIVKIHQANLETKNIAQEAAFAAAVIESHFAITKASEQEVDEVLNEYTRALITNGADSGVLRQLSASINQVNIKNSEKEIVVDITLTTKDFCRIPFVGPITYKSKGCISK